MCGFGAAAGAAQSVPKIEIMWLGRKQVLAEAEKLKACYKHIFEEIHSLHWTAAWSHSLVYSPGRKVRTLPRYPGERWTMRQYRPIMANGLSFKIYLILYGFLYLLRSTSSMRCWLRSNGIRSHGDCEGILLTYLSRTDHRFWSCNTAFNSVSELPAKIRWPDETPRLAEDSSILIAGYHLITSYT